MTTKNEIALSPEQRARQVLRIDARRAVLRAMAAQSADLVEITNPAGYQQLHAARMVLKNERVAIEKAGKEARDDATKFSKAVIAVENELIGLIQPEETRLGAIQQAWDDARAGIAAERAEIEAQRAAEVAAARRREITSATLKGTANEARLRLIELGEGDTLLVAKLAAVLRIEEVEKAA